MNGYRKEENKRDICKSHSARSEREPLRVCPSKLSKRELEDLYYNVLENNVDLKRTINSQQEKIKALSTKVQRMTVIQKSGPGRDNECCSYIKATVHEQNQSIADLKNANERLSERIRVLNMRLCSAKQFLRRSPATSVSRCTKCSAPANSLKNSSVSILHGKQSDTNAKLMGGSNPYLNKDVVLSTRTVETETDEQEKETSEKLCDENKCKSLIEELKQKIVDLQEELSKNHTEYSSRITRLEEEVIELRLDKDRAVLGRAASAQQLQQSVAQAAQLAARLRAAEAQYGELAMELSIEKRKVAELETRVKAVDMSCQVAKTIEEHLSNANQLKNDLENQQLESSASPYISPRDKSSSRLDIPDEPRRPPSDATDQPDENKVSKVSDDSGFAAESPTVDDSNKDKRTLNEVISDRISHLQRQLDMLKLNAERNHLKEIDDSVPCKLLDLEPYPAGGTPDVGDISSFSDVALEAAPTLKSESYIIMKNTDEAGSPTDCKFQNTLSEAGQAEGKDVRTLHNRQTSVVNEHNDFKKKSQNVHTNIESPPSPKAMCDSNFHGVSENAKGLKSDSHNRMQIPGPMPVCDIITGTPNKYSDKGRWKKNGRRRSKSIKKDSDDSNTANVKEVICLNANGKDIKDAARPLDDTVATTSKYEPADFFIAQSDDVVREERRVTDLEPAPCRTVKSSGYIEDKPFTGDVMAVGSNVASKDTELIKVAGPSYTEKFLEDDNSYNLPADGPTAHEGGTRPPAAVVSTTGSNMDNGAPIDICSQHARICTCPNATRRDVRVFRTCSGTLRFRTAPARLRHCGCPPDEVLVTEPGPSHRDTQTDEDKPVSPGAPRRRSATYSKDSRGTYSVPPRSPENTDCEISTLTDLPSEKESKSPRPLSPGEQKLSTFTESYSAPTTTTEYGTLSEGELPGVGREKKLSVGEAKVNFQETEQGRVSGPSPAARMEAALAAIGSELARCRGLLQRAQVPAQMLTSKARSFPQPVPYPLLRSSAAYEAPL